MVQAVNSNGSTGNWWRLSPDNTGSYLNGAWFQLASMPSGYGPLYYASAVLPDGRVVVEGGEYNLGSGQTETNLGAIYNPATNSWTPISPPSGWSRIGDAQSAILADGTMMLGNCCDSRQALLNASTLTWSSTGAGKSDFNDEESWTLLKDNTVLTEDVLNAFNSEAYSPPPVGSWSTRGNTIAQLVNSCTEIGPAVLRPDGTVFAIGGTSNTAIYNTGTRSWAMGPSFPSGLGVSDGPAALLPNGKVLVAASPVNPCYALGTRFYEFDGANLVQVASTPNAPRIASYYGRMLVLPTGQVLFTDGSSNVQVYTPTGTYQSAWQPTITTPLTTLSAGSTNNSISGAQFNGLSQGAFYGDDAQSATNYPLVQIRSNSTGRVVYAKTHNHSTMGVATGSAQVSTQFDIPANIDQGSSTLVVIANGIPSAAANVTITPGSTPWTGSTVYQGQGCNGYFDIFVFQQTNASSTNWNFFIEASDGNPGMFVWSLYDGSGALASGTQNPAISGNQYNFTTIRAPQGPPTLKINYGQYNTQSGCQVPITGRIVPLTQ